MASDFKTGDVVRLRSDYRTTLYRTGTETAGQIKPRPRKVLGAGAVFTVAMRAPLAGIYRKFRDGPALVVADAGRNRWRIPDRLLERVEGVA